MKTKLYFLALLVSLLLNSICSGQTGTTNSGTNFWFGFTDSYDAGTAEYVVYINTTQTTNGTVSVPGMAWSQNFTATPAATTRIVIPSADVYVTDYTAPVGQAVNVVSDSNVSVFSAIEHSLRSDNTCILPVQELGNEYYVVDYSLLASLYSESTEFMVIAQGCVDTVEIIPSQNITIGGTHAANVPYVVVLQPGQVYEVQSATADLTGSLVMSLNHSETGVISGASFDAVSCNNTGNPLFEEMLPVNTWGENFVFFPTPYADDECRVLSEQNGTTVTFYTNSGNNVQTLNAGQYYDTIINAATPVYINSSNPVTVGRFMITGACNNYYVNNPNTLGDPAEGIVDANEQMFLDTAVFYISLTPDFDSMYVQVVTRTTDVNTVFLNNVNIGAYFTTLTPNPIYSYAYVPIAAGTYTLTTTGQGFLAYTCGLGYIEAEVMSAGVYLDEIPLATAVVNPTSCNPNAGTATATVTNGIPPFAYLWSNGQTTQTATGLSAGIYTVTVSDSDCVPHVAVATVTVTVGTPPRDSAVIANSLNCHGGNANATIGVAGGATPYTYLWSPGGNTTASVTGLSVGTYTVTVTDASGCPAIPSPIIISIVHPPALGASIASRVIVQCEEYGYITAQTPSGGTPPYTYSWAPNGGTNMQTVTTLTAGTYTLTVTDSNGCSATAAESITYPPMLTATPNLISEATCYGEDDGKASVTPIGGNQPYTYSWFPAGGTNATAESLSAGTYIVTVTDSNGCTATADVTITQAPGMVITTDSVDVSIFGGCVGEAAVTVVSGGVPPYTYLWSPGGQTTDTIKGQCEGAYCCTVTGANGCSEDVCVIITDASAVANISSGNGPISIYPNPSNGLFTISGINREARVEIYDVLGQNLHTQTLGGNPNKNLINLSDKASGVYFYRVVTNDGSMLGCGKIVIQR